MRMSLVARIWRRRQILGTEETGPSGAGQWPGFQLPASRQVLLPDICYLLSAICYLLSAICVRGLVSITFCRAAFWGLCQQTTPSKIHDSESPFAFLSSSAAFFMPNENFLLIVLFVAFHAVEEVLA